MKTTLVDSLLFAIELIAAVLIGAPLILLCNLVLALIHFCELCAEDARNVYHILSRRA